MARKVDREAAVTLTVACVRCGQPIVLVARDDGVEIPDRDEFMRLHRDCLTEPPASNGGTRDVTGSLPARDDETG